jgi:hypothetical protein
MPRALPPLLAFAVAFVLFSPTLGYGLLGLDDPRFLGSVPFVHERSLENLRLLVSEPVFGAWHPLHQASYALDAALLGDRPLAFHLGNVLLYAAMAALVALLARGLGRSPLAAGAAALLFAVHPAHVENVAWISARKDVLSGALGLAAVVLYLRPSRRSYVLALALMTLALLAKSVAAMLVFVLVAQALIERRLDRREALRLAPFVAFGLAALAIHVSAQATIGATVGPFGGSWVSQARLALRTIERSMSLALFPFALTVRPPFPELSPGLEVADVRSALVLLAALATFVAGARARRPWALPFAIFFITLAPTSNLVPFPAFVQDRYLLLPSVGLALVAGDAFAALAAKRRDLAFVLGGVVLAVLGGSAFAAEGAWSSDAALWENAARRNPDDLDALEGQGRSLIQTGEDPETIARGEAILRRVVARAPNRFEANFQLAIRRWRQQDLEGAREHLLAAGAGTANVRWQADALLVELDLRRDDLPEAAAALARARELAPRTAEVEVAGAQLALARRQPDEALRCVDAAIGHEPGIAALRVVRASALRALGRRGEAFGELAQARTRGASEPDVAALEALLLLDRGEREAARARLATQSPRAAGTLIARARVAAQDGAAKTAQALVASAVAAIGSGARREALAEPDLATALGGK